MTFEKKRKSQLEIEAKTPGIKIKYFSYSEDVNIPKRLQDVADCFSAVELQICSRNNNYGSDAVLRIVSEGLKLISFRVEKDKKNTIYFKVSDELGFKVDCYEKESGTIIEVEAGRGVRNFQFLKDFVEACYIPGINYLVIVVRLRYESKSRSKSDSSKPHDISYDFNRVVRFIRMTQKSDRMKLPLKGILVLGY